LIYYRITTAGKERHFMIRTYGHLEVVGDKAYVIGEYTILDHLLKIGIASENSGSIVGFNKEYPLALPTLLHNGCVEELTQQQYTLWLLGGAI